MADSTDEATPLPEKLRQVRPDKLVRFPWSPGREANEPNEVRMRALVLEEQDAAALSANDFIARFAKGTTDKAARDRLFTDEFRVEVLFRACRHAEKPNEGAFPSPQQIRAKVTSAELDAAFSHYLTVCDERGPFRDRLSDDELDDLVSQLASAGSAYPADLLSDDEKNLLLVYMAYRLRPVPQATDQ